MKKKIEKILEYIRIMEQNTFLLKDSWSDNIPMLNADFEYRTYVGKRGDEERYINFELYKVGKILLTITFRKNVIKLDKPIDLPFSIDSVLKVVEQIYTEVHSFENHNEALRKLKKKIIDSKKRIESEIKELEKLQTELSDYKKLNK